MKSTPKRPTSEKLLRHSSIKQPSLPGRGAGGNARPKSGLGSCNRTLPDSRCNRTARPRTDALHNRSGTGHSNDRRYSAPPADRTQCSETLCRPCAQRLVLPLFVSRVRHSGASDTENQPLSLACPAHLPLRRTFVSLICRTTRKSLTFRKHVASVGATYRPWGLPRALQGPAGADGALCATD